MIYGLCHDFKTVINCVKSGYDRSSGFQPADPWKLSNWKITSLHSIADDCIVTNTVNEELREVRKAVIQQATHPVLLFCNMV